MDDQNGTPLVKTASLYGVSGAIDSEVEVLDDVDQDLPEGRSTEP